MPLDPGSPFIGRQYELDALLAALARALAGQPGVVLLAGEPGIGKTRLAQEVAARAAHSGVLALWGRSPEDPGAPPYWPWLQMIRRYLAVHDAPSLAETLGSAAAYIAALDPERRDRLSDGAALPVEDIDSASARFRLFDSIAGFWRRAAARQPLLLLIDDLHLADVPSLRLLEFVMAEAGGSRLMLLGTYRDAEVVRQHPLSATLAELPRHVPLQRLLLGGFSLAESAQFVAGSIRETTSELTAMLYEKTAGHPLFLTELARDFQQTRRMNATTRRIDMTRVPAGVREVIGARLSRLTPACVHVVKNAAVFGRTFRADLLRRMSDDLPEDDYLAALDEAQTASLIEAAGEPDTCQFSHALVRDAVYEDLPAAQRARLHRKVGELFEDRFAADLTPCLSQLAHHYYAAGGCGDFGDFGDSAKAIDYATRAAERATSMQAHEEAARHYLRAGAALPAGSISDAPRCRLLLGLGNAQNSAGASALALATFSEAAAAARRLGDASLLARAAIGFGDAQWRLGSDGGPAVELIREALAEADRTQGAQSSERADTRERASLLTALCQGLLFANRPDEAEAAFHEAVAMARRLDDALILFRALCAILPGRWFPDRLALRLSTAREAIAVAQRARHPEWATPYLSGWHIGDLMESGETAAATAMARDQLATAETMHEPFVEAVALVALTMIATHEGRFAEAENLAADALRCGSRFDRANAAGIFSVQMFTLRRQQGRLRELAPVLRQFLDNKSPAATWQPGLAVLYCELNARDEARAAFVRLAAGGFAGIAHDAMRIASLAYLAEVCVWLDDDGCCAHAATLYDLILPYAGRNVVFGAHTASFGAADRLLGMLAATLRRWDVAQRHFADAIAFDERTGGWPWLARSRHAFAAMLLRRGDAADHQPALSLLDAALGDARQLGMHGLEQAVGELQQQAAGGEQPRIVAGLSARELQVLQLVAAGRTNQQIAAVLFRSPNTVANHVRNILGKTQTANRAEAAAFAVRHGLLPPP